MQAGLKRGKGRVLRLIGNLSALHCQFLVRTSVGDNFDTLVLYKAPLCALLLFLATNDPISHLEEKNIGSSQRKFC